MPEETVQQEASPEIKQEVKQEEPDLIKRVSQIKTETQVKQEVDEKFNINDLDSKIEQLPDPQLKEQVLGLKKSLLKGENQKYQEIANLRKQYEQRLAEVTTWTPDRIRQEMTRPDFVQAANEILQSQNKQSDEVSGLSETERRRIEQAEKAANAAQAQLLQLQQSQIHSRLQSKYANYDPNTVQNDIVQLASGKLDAETIIESAWKARDYENAVKRAYELGLIDKKAQNVERVNGMSYQAGLNMPQPLGVERQKGETTQQFIQRSYQEHIKKK